MEMLVEGETRIFPSTYHATFFSPSVFRCCPGQEKGGGGGGEMAPLGREERGRILLFISLLCVWLWYLLG